MKKYKEIHTIADEKLIKNIPKIQGKVSYSLWKDTPTCKIICVDKFAIEYLGIHTKHKLRYDYFYNLHIWESNDNLIKYKSNAPTKALKLINKHLGTREPYCEYASRKSDMLINYNDFVADVPYTGYFTQIDMNSAEPYFVACHCPQMRDDIEKLHNKRKIDPHAKLALVSINGNLRNTHISIYNKVNDSLYNEMLRIARNILTASFGKVKPFAIRRDALILYSNDNYTISQICKMCKVKCGTGLGEFKAVQEYGTATPMNNNLNYNTDMKQITTKHTGTHIHCNEYFEMIKLTMTRYNNKSVEIMR